MQQDDPLMARLIRVQVSLREIRPRLRARRKRYRTPGEEDLAIDPRPRLSETALDEFEVTHGVRLPMEYRKFLTIIGNGGPGPGFGMFALDRPCDLSALLSEQQRLPVPPCQLIPLAGMGCGIEWDLVISGPDTGNVWIFWEDQFEPCNPRRGFLEWYEAWLTEETQSGGPP